MKYVTLVDLYPCDTRVRYDGGGTFTPLCHPTASRGEGAIPNVYTFLTPVTGTCRALFISYPAADRSWVSSFNSELTPPSPSVAAPRRSPSPIEHLGSLELGNGIRLRALSRGSSSRFIRGARRRRGETRGSPRGGDTPGFPR